MPKHATLAAAIADLRTITKENIANFPSKIRCSPQNELSHLEGCCPMTQSKRAVEECNRRTVSELRMMPDITALQRVFRLCESGYLTFLVASYGAWTLTERRRQPIAALRAGKLK